MRDHMLDPVQLGVPVRVGGFLPRPGALEANAPRVQDLPQPFTANAHRPGGAARQVGGELAQAPAGERQAQLLGPGGGRGDDHVHVLSH
jgi:hypothetical protein